ncbi:MAG: hypothetical protein ACJA07_000519 [Rhodococcus sp. (in: high G+C Gram-positive bacteria)]|jgi:hypothetical protein
MIDSTVAISPATASATLAQTFVEATMVIGPSTAAAGPDVSGVVSESELQALSVRAAAQDRPTSAVAVRGN